MRSVLVIDDNVDFSENLQEILEDEGYTVWTAESAEAGVAVLESTQVDLVLTDMRMPGMDGAELTCEIRSRWPCVPVVPMTAYSSDQALDEAHRCGAVGLLSKPIHIDYLCREVARFAGDGSCVLIVEDDPDMATNLTEILHDVEGLAPHWAKDLETARRVAASKKLGAAVIDLKLPDGNGIELGRELAASGSDGFPVVYITGYGSSADDAARTSVAPGHQVLLRKPFGPAELLAALKGGA